MVACTLDFEKVEELTRKFYLEDSDNVEIYEELVELLSEYFQEDVDHVIAHETLGKIVELVVLTHDRAYTIDLLTRLIYEGG